MSARDELLLAYDLLESGTSIAGELCPACKGGSTGERTLSISKEDGQLKWYCHRSSCGFRGIEAAGRRSYSITKPVSTRGFTGRTFIRTCEAVPETIQKVLTQRYQIDQSHLSRWNIGWDADSQRLVIPVLGPTGEELGAVLRTLDKAITPKSKSHIEENALSWHMNPRATHSGVIVVEDQWSAIRSADYMNSCALMGTNINESRMEEIRSLKQKVYLALDADAWNVAVKYAIKYKPMQLVRLTKDIKDLNDEELKELMDGITAT